MELTAAVCVGFILDLWLGDPEGWPHPVRWIGKLISGLEGVLRRIAPSRIFGQRPFGRGTSETQTDSGKAAGELAAGAVLAALVPVVSGLVSGGILWLAGKIHPRLSFLLMCVMSWQLLAARSLRDESRKVYLALQEKDIEKARRAVSRIVGRDTERLTEEGIIRAAVETVAENASDGVTAPLFYLLIFGPVGGFVYKAVNTMDSMVGYRNDRYLYFGRAAARLDDLANLIPSRLTALVMIFCAWILPGFDGGGAWRIWKRDRRCHKSPNSAQGEAACAGALHIRLAGDAWYFGRLHEKPTIGDDDRSAEPEDILRADRLMYAAALFFLLAGAGLRLWLSHAL